MEFHRPWQSQSCGSIPSEAYSPVAHRIDACNFGTFCFKALKANQLYGLCVGVPSGVHLIELPEAEPQDRSTAGAQIRTNGKPPFRFTWPRAISILVD